MYISCNLCVCLFCHVRSLVWIAIPAVEDIEPNSSALSSIFKTAFCQTMSTGTVFCPKVCVCVCVCMRVCVCVNMLRNSDLYGMCACLYFRELLNHLDGMCACLYLGNCWNTMMACVHVCVSGTCAKTLGVDVSVSGNSAETFGGACDPEQHDPGGHHALLHHSESSYTPCTHWKTTAAQY